MSRVRRSSALFAPLLSLMAACAQPTVSVCPDTIPLPEGSPWPARDEARARAVDTFYQKTLRGMDGLTPEDLYTFVRQGALGDIPVKEGDAVARHTLEQRYLLAEPDPEGPLWTQLDPEGEVGRLHLGRYRAAGHPFEPLYRAAQASSAALTVDPSELDWRICRVRALSERGQIPLTLEQWPAVVALWQAGAAPAHSASYTQFRQTSYVVLRKVDVEPLLRAMETSTRVAGAASLP